MNDPAGDAKIPVAGPNAKSIAGYGMATMNNGVFAMDVANPARILS
jgi:hypothetical protein